MKSFKSACMLAATFAAACKFAVAPDPAAGLGPVATVNSALADEAIGQMFPASDGLWAFIPDDASRKRGFEPGALVAFGGDVDGPRNLFGVVAVLDWGVSLQRLDADPPSGDANGALIPITQTDQQTASRWGMCVGDGDVASSECIRSFPYGYRWSVYALDETGRLRLNSSPLDSPTLPIALVGQVHRSELGTDVVGFDLPQRWLAIPAPEPSSRPTRPRIAIDGSCSGLGSTFRDAMNAEWLPSTIAAPENELQISSEAIRLGADALAWCPDGVVHVGVPTLFRPRVPVIGRDFSSPPLLGANIIRIPKRSAEMADWVLRLSAALSTGDWVTADLIAESAVRRFGKAQPLEEVVIDSMAGIAEGGRPEAAARLGSWATRLQWNQKNSPGWQLGMSRVETHLGNRKSAISRTADIVDVLDVAKPQYRAFMGYFAAVPEMKSGAKGREALKPLEETPHLSLPARALRGQEDESFGTMKSEFDAAKATWVFDALNGTLAELPCDRDPCTLDVYGRIWSSKSAPAEALSRVGRAELRPGFDPALSGRSGIEELTSQVALFPLIETDQRQTALSRATEAFVAWAADGCQGSPSPAKTAGLDAQRRAGDSDEARVLTWLSTSAVDVACGTAAQLAESAEELGLVAERTNAPPQLFQQKVDAASDADLLGVLTTAAGYTAKFERKERCARWTLALAAAYTSAHDVDNASYWAEQALRCDIKDRSSIDFIGAYLNFQRTSSTAVDFDDATRAQLRRVIHADTGENACVGTDPIGYDVLRPLPKDVRVLAARLQVPKAPPTEELSLVTANDRLTAAREQLATVLTRMDARDFTGAARSLGHATGSFQALSHEVGIARARWVDAVLFDGQAETLAAQTELEGKAKVEFKSVGYPALRKKGTLTEIAQSDPVAANVVAVLRDSARVPELRNDKQLPHRGKLCEPAPRKVQGLAIDRVDGDLKDVRGRGELEVELANPDEVAPE